MPLVPTISWPLPRLVGLPFLSFRVPRRFGRGGIGGGAQHGQPVLPGARLVVSKASQDSPFQKAVGVFGRKRQGAFKIGQRQFKFVQKPVSGCAKDIGIGPAVFALDGPVQVLKRALEILLPGPGLGAVDQHGAVDGRQLQGRGQHPLGARRGASP